MTYDILLNRRDALRSTPQRRSIMDMFAAWRDKNKFYTEAQGLYKLSAKKSNEYWGIFRIAEKDTKDVNMSDNGVTADTPVVGIQIIQEDAGEETSARDASLLHDAARFFAEPETPITTGDDGHITEGNQAVCDSNKPPRKETDQASIRTIRQSDVVSHQPHSVSSPSSPTASSRAEVHSPQPSRAGPGSPTHVTNNYHNYISYVLPSDCETATDVPYRYTPSPTPSIINSLSGDGNVAACSGMPFGGGVATGDYNTTQFGGVNNRGSVRSYPSPHA